MPAPPSPSPSLFNYQLGLALVHGPAFLGESSRATGLAPVWSLRWGRYRITNSRASLIEREPGHGALPGASMELGAYGRWRFDAALRLDTGQDRAEGADQAGLQSVSSTVRGRFTASYRMASGLGAELALTTDLLNRGGGTTLGLDLSRRFSLSPEWRLNLGAGISLADAIHQRSRYGVSAEESVRHRPAALRAGWWLAGDSPVHRADLATVAALASGQFGGLGSLDGAGHPQPAGRAGRRTDRHRGRRVCGSALKPQVCAEAHLRPQSAWFLHNSKATGMTWLILGLALFLGVHSVRIVADDWRSRQIQQRGENAWKGLYTVVSLLGFALIVWGYGQARQAPVVLWATPVWTRHLAALLMLLSFVLLAAAYVPRNALKARLQHPMVLAVKVWALAHLLANNTLADLLLFGAFLVWSVLDFRSARRRPATAVQATAAGTGLTVLVGTLAWAAFAFWAHAAWIGVRPFGGA